MKSLRVHVALIVAMLLVLITGTYVSAAGGPFVLFEQDFETDTNGWLTVIGASNYGNVVRVPSGQDGIPSAAGGFHAQFSGSPNVGPFTRFGGYKSVWPGTWTAEIDVYLDTAWPDNSGFDYAVATSGADGNHRRDFIFHVAKDTSTGNLLVGASNNSNGNPRQDLETLTPHYVVPTSGWYTLQHVFRDNGGVLAVDLNVVNSSGVTVFTATRTDPSDLIPTVVGGNRYGWFVFIRTINLAVDNTSLTTFPGLEIVDAAVAMQGVNTLNVPVNLHPGEVDLSAVGFSVEWDNACLVFDGTTDSDNNGIPDAVLGLPPTGFKATVAHSGQKVTILVDPFAATPPLPVLAEGTLATLVFDAQGCGNLLGTPVPVTFSFPTSTVAPLVPSFGTNFGQSLVGGTEGGTVTLTFNASPTDITLDGNTLNENLPAATAVGTLCTADPDGGDCAPNNNPFTYSVSTTGCPGPDNYAFQIVGKVLQSAVALDHEAQDTYNICVRSTDAHGLWLNKTFAIVVGDVNEAPTGIGVSGDVPQGVYRVPEKLPAGHVVGQLSTTDVDSLDMHTYSFCPPAVPFQIVGNELQTSAPLDFEVQSSYNVCIRSTDQGLLFVERALTISVVDANDAPVAVNDPGATPLVVVGDGLPVVIDVLANDTDQDNDVLTLFSFDQAANQGTVVNNGTNFGFTAQLKFNGIDTFTYIATDDGGVGNVGTPLQSNSATVTVNVVANDKRADCNADGKVDAADFPATVLEIFDTDDAISWWRTHTGSFVGSPRGCDSNASENGPNPATPLNSVDAGDITCTVLVFFGNTACTTPSAVAAAAGQTAILALPVKVEGAVGATVAVPVTLDSAGNDVAAASFVLAYDPTAASFDTTDSDADGLPDAIALNIPASMAKTVVVDADAGTIKVAVYGTSLPMALLGDGVLATIGLELDSDASALALTQVSLGSNQGYSIPVSVDGNTAPLFGGRNQSIFLPLLNTRR
jgi:hypothetical protein